MQNLDKVKHYRSESVMYLAHDTLQMPLPLTLALDVFNLPTLLIAVLSQSVGFIDYSSALSSQSPGTKASDALEAILRQHRTQPGRL